MTDSLKPGLILLAVFASVSVILLIVCGLVSVYTYQQLARERSAAGFVVRLETQTHYDSETGEPYDLYYPVLRFRLPDGTFVETRSSIGASPPDQQPGDEITVLYNPDNPSEARVDSPANRLLSWVASIITGGIGLIFGLVAFFIWRLTHFLKDPEPV